jgi:hypothetical protein
LEALAPEDIAVVLLARRLWWHRTICLMLFFGGFGLVIWGAAAQGSEVHWAAVVGTLLVLMSLPWLLVTMIRTWWNRRKLRALVEHLGADAETPALSNGSAESISAQAGQRTSAEPHR